MHTKFIRKEVFPTNNSITSLLNLKENEVEYCKEIIKNNHHYFYVRLVNHGGRCPHCSRFTKKIKEYYNKHIIHSIFIKDPSTIIYQARRFICPECNTTFYESNPFIKDDYKKLSSSTIDNILFLLKNYSNTFSYVAKQLNISVTQVITVFDEHVQPKRNNLTECICIDEFFFSKHTRKKYALLILSFTNGKIIDILPTREKHVLSSFLRKIPIEERKIVKYVSIDMNKIYKDVVSIYFPWATICCDSFHVMKNINKALDDIRLRVMKKFESNKKSDEYYLLKYQKRLLFMDLDDDSYHKKKRNHHFKYEVTDRRKLEMMLAIDEELTLAYELKESYLLFNRRDGSLDEKREELEIQINRFISSNIPEMMIVGLTLDNWKIEITNSFIKTQKKYQVDNKTKTIYTRVSNGPIEGKNKYIKIILKLANGYSNFSRFRNRAMYILNKDSIASDEKLENNVKRKIK